MDFQVIILLLFRLAIVAGPTTSYSATGNKMFTKLHQVNQTLVYYQHKLVVHRVIQIPCYLESPNLSISSRDSVSYEWLMNGRQIRKHTPFVYGTWDVDGVLTILAIVIRRTTIWCHARAEFAVGPHDFYFAHQIQFYEEPVYQTVISVLMVFPMPKDALERKCKYEKHTCDCRTEHGPNATEIFDLGLKTHFVKDTLQDLALDTCNQENTCLAVSLDDFQCINDQPNNRSVHHTTFSFFLYPGRSYSHLKAWKPFNDTYHRKTLFKKFQMRATEKCQNLKKYLESQYYLLDTSCKITVQVAHFEFCMGAAGRLENDVKECQLCPTGTFAQSRLISPAPPRVRTQYQALQTDQPYLIDKHAREAEVSDWLIQEHELACLPCPSNTYNEEIGRMVCLPCPVWHMTPVDPEGVKPVQTGSEWLSEACPPEGRAEVRLVQVADGMLGARFARWVRDSSPLTRVGTLLMFALIPLFIAVILLFIAYVLIDVGSTLVKMANKMHPLQVQIAETTTATAQFKAEQRQVAAEAYARMKGK